MRCYFKQNMRNLNENVIKYRLKFHIKGLVFSEAVSMRLGVESVSVPVSVRARAVR